MFYLDVNSLRQAFHACFLSFFLGLRDVRLDYGFSRTIRSDSSHLLPIFKLSTKYISYYDAAGWATNREMFADGWQMISELRRYRQWSFQYTRFCFESEYCCYCSSISLPLSAEGWSHYLCILLEYTNSIVRRIFGWNLLVILT